MDNYIGKMLDDRYEILEVIGTGGMAVVYKAKCHRLNRLVAVKILKDEYFRDEEFRRRFRAESQAVAMLSHPNIMAVYDVSQSGETDYIVMELIDGITMKQYMEKKGVLNWRETLHFSMQIAKALEHAHSRGIVHRDIKPQNIMILKNGSVKVADFGIARVSSAQSTLTREALGSVHYISPEQAKGSRVDNRSDLYSLGVVMYEMLTGRPPYDGESPVAVAIKHINAGAPMPSELNPDIPGGLEQITMHAMCANLEERYSSATEMLYDMEEFRKDPSILFRFRAGAAPVHTRTPRIQEKTPAERRAEERARRRKLEEERRKAKRRRIRNLLLVSGTILVAVIGIILLLNSCDREKVELVTVPDFKDMVFADLSGADYPGLKLVEDNREYSTEFEAGHIISQSPEPDVQVEEGTRILLVVSLGEQSSDMPDLLEMKSSEAEKLLKELDMELTIRIESVYDDLIEKDRVVRTDPIEGIPLAVEQTVTLYVSRGTEEVQATVPQVKGESLATAISMLTKAKLEYERNYVDSDKEKDTVVAQSIKAGEKVAEGTVITLDISNGPKQEDQEKQPDNNDPPEPPPEDQNNTGDTGGTNDLGTSSGGGPGEQMVTKIYTVTVPAHSDTVKVDVLTASNAICGESQYLEPDTNSIDISLDGSGSVTYNVYVDDKFSYAFTIDFN